MMWLRDNLPRLQTEGHRMLIFSQWTRLLDLLEILVNELGMQFLRLDGSTAVSERQHLINTFSTTSIPVFLLSTKAGGLGINLTQADVVILHDLDFNPENDRQAEDRSHRIGQTRPVVVYKLVAEATGTVYLHSLYLLLLCILDVVSSG
jgi:SNF2 family DNA or RNA helicase